MFLPGMNYQDYAWDLTKKALGMAALEAFRKIGVPRLIDDNYFEQNLLDVRMEMSNTLLRLQSRLVKTRNGQDRDAFELASELVLALTPLCYLDPANPTISSKDWKRIIWPKDARPKFFTALIRKITEACGGKAALDVPDNVLRKIANDVFADLRDEVDVQSFKAETGESMTVNHLHNIRKVDQGSHAVRAILENWSSNKEYASLILGYAVEAEPIEHRRLRNGGRCKAEWLLRWSEYFGAFNDARKKGGASPAVSSMPAVGCFHTRSKQFTPSVKNIDEILKLLDPFTGRYQAVANSSLNLDSFIGVLENFDADIVDDAQHASRVRAAEHEAVADESDQGCTDALPEQDESEDASMAELDALLATHPAEDDVEADVDILDKDALEAPPGNIGIAAEIVSDTQDSEGEQDDIDRPNPWTGVWRLLENYALPIQVGVLRELSKTLDNDDLLDAIESMGLFEAWGLELNVNLLTDAELARRLPRKPNGKLVSAGTVKNWIAKAQAEFLGSAMQTYAGTIGGAGRKGE